MTASRNALSVRTQVDFNGKNLIQKHAQNRKVVVMAGSVRLTILIPVGANGVLGCMAFLLNRAVKAVTVTSRDSSRVSNSVRAARIQMEFNGNLEIPAPTGRQVVLPMKLKVVGAIDSVVLDHHVHYSVTFNCDFVPLNRIEIKRESTSYVSFNSLQGERKITNNMPKLGSPSRTSPMVNLWKINASLYFFSIY